MGDKTAISWTHWKGTVGRVWNPTRGCSRASTGCQGCYAERQAYRFSGAGKPYEGLVALGKHGPRWTGRVDIVRDKLIEPIRWRARSTVFVNSMSDLFHESLPDHCIDEVFGVMAACSEHTFIVLTKRAARMRAYLSTDLRAAWAKGGAPKFEDGDRAWDSIAFGPSVLPNVVLGVSVENQRYADERIPELLATPAAVRFVSYEPALEAVDFTRIACGEGWTLNALVADTWAAGVEGTGRVLGTHPALSWVIVGAESGPGHRPFDVAWAASVVAQCKAAGVSVYVKQDSAPRSGVQGRIPDDLWSVKELPGMAGGGEARGGVERAGGREDGGR